MTSSARIASDPDSEQQVLGALTLLPSESAIHFLVYSSLVLLTLMFVVGTPAIALLFAEHRPVAGGLFVVINLAVFCLSFGTNLRRHFQGPRPRWWEPWIKRMIRACRKLPATKGLCRLIGFRLSQDFAPFPDASGTSAFFNFYSECWKTTGEKTPLPRLYWNYQDSRATARVAGSSRNPVVAISAGLVSLLPHESEAARVYLLHEFGHVVNRDLEVFGLTMSGSRACRAVILSSSILSALLLLQVFNGDVAGALILLVGTMWVLSLGFLWLFMARYAGVIFSLRELYADVQAVLWLRGLGGYERVLGNQASSRISRIWHKFRSLVTLRLIHLSPWERLAFLRRPGSLLFPRHRYYVLVGLLLVTLQSNAFAEGYENN